MLSRYMTAHLQELITIILCLLLLNSLHLYFGRTLRVAWDVLKEQSERIAQIHLEASGQLADAAGRLNEFIKRQKAERTPVSSRSLDGDKYSMECRSGDKYSMECRSFCE